MWKGILVLVIGIIGIMGVLIDANCNEKTTAIAVKLDMFN